MAKGIFPEDHPLSCGMTGIWGTRVANDVMRGADVLLAVGTVFGEADCSSWRPEYTFAIPPTRLMQIDIDPQEIGKLYPVEIGLVGDARTTLRQLNEHLQGTPIAAAGRSSADRRRGRGCDRAGPRSSSPSQRDDGVPIHPARLLAEIAKVAPTDTIYVTDVGWNKNGAGQQLPVPQPQSFITSGGMATMGFAPAAAIGAKIGQPTGRWWAWSATAASCRCVAR